MPDFNAFYESFFSDRRQEEEPMGWEDAPSLPEVSAPFVPTRTPRKMRSLISVQVSEPPSLSANRFPTMRALVPKNKLKEYAEKLFTYLSGGEMAIYREIFLFSPTGRVDKPDFTGGSQQICLNLTVVTSSACDLRQEQEPMDWEDAPFLPEVSAPFVPTRPPRKMRSLISVQVSEPPSLSANRFPNMRALVPKDRRRFESSSDVTNAFRSRNTVYFLQVILCRPEGVFPYTPGAALRDQSSRPPSGVPRATLFFE
ncbi:hypothetical protein TNCV_4643451 [Trichonephila clavipes]|nr:hypothetical protein TNCV_4643451 [Trichonephila clavipes]